MLVVVLVYSNVESSAVTHVIELYYSWHTPSSWTREAAKYFSCCAQRHVKTNNINRRKCKAILVSSMYTNHIQVNVCDVNRTVYTQQYLLHENLLLCTRRRGVRSCVKLPTLFTTGFTTELSTHVVLLNHYSRHNYIHVRDARWNWLVSSL